MSLKSGINQIPSQALGLMLDVVLEVMRAERGSIMLIDDKCQELSIQSARGLKSDIIREARVRLGSGISGKVAASGQAVFLEGISEDRRLSIKPVDFVNQKIDTSYVAPIRLHNGTLGTININSLKPDHQIRPEKEELVQKIISRFHEYLAQVDLPFNYHEEPSQLYMMNIFREYSTLREIRALFDFIFHLVAELLKTKKKGVFLLKNSESGFFDLVLGYGFDIKRNREIYEELVPALNKSKVELKHDITMFNRKELFEKPDPFFQEEFCILIPLKSKEETNGQLFIFNDERPALEENIRSLLQSICDAGGAVIEKSASLQRFDELTFTDSLTGTYNYGLWWKRLHEEISRTQRNKGTKISLIVFDIDQFDRFNRAHGYLMGDHLLRVIGDRIKSVVRVVDLVGRIGGQEFGVALPDTSKQDGLWIAERILNSISDLPNEMRIHLSKPLTLSGGVAGFPDDADTPGDLVEKAKTALVSAKIMGGNRIQSVEHFEE
ncbi:MAG TPA: sensor domain-containing diguanylate cyclase [Desulfobacteraceae bacterium]|nr:sensor domain-containing diguanylate cyclase [Desulfobacteraceae bacterium]